MTANKLILVIDDEQQISMLICEWLEESGYKTIAALDGEMGEKLCHSESPDLVICDLIMPNQEGLETISGLRHDFPDIKIIAISGGIGNAAADFLQIAIHLGANKAFAKPFSLKELQVAIKELIGD